MEALNWKTFTLVAHANENDDDDVQNIAKKLTMEAIAKDLCVLVHDDEEDGEKYNYHQIIINLEQLSIFTCPKFYI